MIWHDNYVVWGDEAQPTSRRISDLTFREFHQLAPINGSSEPEAEVPMGASPTSSCMSFSSMDSGSSGANRLLRKLRNDAPAVPYEPTLRSWAVEQEDHFPTLADVFAGIPPSVAFDLEVKMAVPDDVAVTPAAEVDRMVSAILAAVDAGLAAHGPRLIVFSSFDPEVCLEIKQRCARVCCPAYSCVRLPVSCTTVCMCAAGPSGSSRLLVRPKAAQLPHLLSRQPHGILHLTRSKHCLHVCLP